MNRRNRIPFFLTALLVCVFTLFLTLTSCGTDDRTDRNAILSVTPDGDGSLVIEAQLTNGFLSGYTEKVIYLFELPSAYSTAAELTGLSPVAEVKPNESMRITVSMTDGARTRLYSSFMLATYDAAKGVYAPITTPVAVSVVESLSDRAPAESLPEVSIKGLISDQVGDAVGLGIAHTLLDVDMATMILSDWQEGAVVYVYNGYTAYLNGDALDKLDRAVAQYTRHGVHVYLRFTLGAPTDTTPPELYALANPAASSAQSFAVNMDSVTAAHRMEGFFDYMADRYADPAEGQAPVTAFILGYRVNDPDKYNAAANTTLPSYVTNYEKLTRVADTALRAHNPDGRVYISVDSHRSARTMQGGWDVTAFLAAFRDECALRGDYPWQVAGELTAPNPYLWEENTAVDTEFYTIHSLGTLTDLLSSEVYATPDGYRRSLAITGFSIPAAMSDGNVTQVTQQAQAASYAYAYTVCSKNPCVESLLYSVYADTAEPDGLRGLRGIGVTPEGTAVLLEKRWICHVFRLIDTTERTSLSGELGSIIGSAYTKLEASQTGKTPPATAVSGEGKLTGSVTESLDAATLFTFGDGTEQGFADGGGLIHTALRPTENLQNYHGYLYALFDGVNRGDAGCITVRVPAKLLIGGEKLVLDLYAGDAADPEAGDTAVTLRLTRPSTGATADGNGAILYESRVEGVSGNRWQRATYDVSNFTSLLSEEDEVILTVAVDSPTGDAFALGLAGVFVTGNTVGLPIPVGLVVTVVVILILVVGGAFLLLLLRNKDKKQEE